jgi:hypothetical protein
MLEAVGGVNPTNYLSIICCLPVILVVTIILLALSLKRLRVPSPSSGVAKAIPKLAVVVLTFVIVAQLQIFYEVSDMSEYMKPKLTFYDTSASMEVHQVNLDQGRVWDGDALFIGQRGLLAYIASEDGNIVLKTRTTADGIRWDEAIHRLILGSMEVIRPWDIRCDLRSEQSKVECIYSYGVIDPGVPRVSWIITTSDMTNWSVPKPTTGPSQGVSGKGFELPYKLSNFRDVEVRDLSAIPTEAGGHLLAIGYDRTDSDVVVFEGSFYALGTRDGDWTSLVRIPAGSRWSGPIKLHEIFPGNFLAVNLARIVNDFYALSYVDFPESAFRDLKSPVMQVP